MDPQVRLIVIIFSFISLASGCAKKASDSAYDTSSAEVVSASIAGAANASDSGGSVVSLNKNPNENLPLMLKLKNLGSELFESRALATACSSSASVIGQSCGGGGSNVMTMILGGCTGFVGTWTGTATLTFNSGASCTNANSSGLISMGNNNSMTFTSSGGLTLTAFSGYSVVTDSNASGYANSLSGGTTVTCGGSGCSNSRTVNISGIHRVLKGPGGLTLFDHTLSTPTALTISGTGSSKQISSGTVQLQHNLAKYTATAQITSTLTFTSGCCLPTGGSVTTTFSSGTKSGSETVTFGPSCGGATVNGNAVTLSYCQ